MSKISLQWIVEREKTFSLLNGNSRREFVLNSLDSNATFTKEGEEKIYLYLQLGLA